MAYTSGLVELVKEHCLLRGDFTLASGQRSDYYLDLRRLTLSQHVREVAWQVIWAIPGPAHVDAIGGPETGANQIVGGVLATIDLYKLRGFVVRKQEKSHGPAGLVVGSVKPGDRCVLVEDVTTTGGSLVRSVEAVRAFGCEVVHAVTIVDRLQGGQEALAAVGVPLVSLMTVRDLGV